MMHRRNLAVPASMVVCLAMLALAACGRQSPEKKAQHEGLLRMHEGNYKEAVEMFERAIELNPNYIEAYVELSRAYGNLRQYDKALEVLDRAIAIDPRERSVYVRKANTQYDMGDGRAMVETADKINEVFGPTPGGHCLRARGLVLQSKWDEALAAYQAAIDLDNKYVEAYKGKSAILLTEMKLDEAAATLEQLLAAAPDELEGQVELALVRAQQGRIDEAKAKLEELNKKNANNPHILSALALVALEQKDYPAAKKLAEETLRLAGRNPIANKVFGACLLEEGLAKQAVPFLEAAAQALPGDRRAKELLVRATRASAPVKEAREKEEQLKAAPDNAELALSVARDYLEMGWSQEALEPSEQALAAMPDNREALLIRALALATSQRAAEARDLLAQYDLGENEYMLRSLAAHLNGDSTKAIELGRKAVKAEQETPWAHFTIAAALLLQGKLREAVQEYDNAYMADNAVAIAQINKAQLYQSLGLINPAISTLTNVLMRNPDDSKVLLRLAALLDARDNPADAERLILKVLEDEPDNDSAMLLLAAHYENRRDYLRAIQQYMNLLKRHPDDIGVKTRLANLRFLNKEFSTGISLMQEVAKANPTALAPKISIGLAYAAQGRWDDAAAVYNEVLNASPTHGLALAHLSIVRQMQGKHDEALGLLNQVRAIAGEAADDLEPQRMTLHIARKEYDQAADIVEQSNHPNDYKRLCQLVIDACREDGADPSRLSLARAIVGAGWRAVAIDQYAQVAAEQPRNALAHAAIGELRILNGENELAVSSLQMALNQFEDSAYLHRKMGEALMMLKQHPRALEHLQHSVELDPANAPAWLSLAQLYEAERKPVEAQSAYRRAIQLNPNDATSYNNLAYILAGEKTSREQALGYANRALELRPHDGNIHDTVGYIYMLMGDDATDSAKKQEYYENAFRAIENALTLMPDQPTLTFHYAQILERRERLDDAVKMYRRALGIDPNFPESTEATRALERLKQRGFN